MTTENEHFDNTISTTITNSDNSIHNLSISDYNELTSLTDLLISDEQGDLLNTGSNYNDIDGINIQNYKYSAMHINIHSLPSKFDQLKEIIVKLKLNNTQIDFILLCETFLNEENSDMYQIPGYSFIKKNRKRNLIIGEIYRIPNTNEIKSIERYETILNKLSNTKQEILIGTDQNIDLPKINDKQNTADFLNMFYSTGIIPTITRPIRITHTSATLIDNIYVKCDKYENIKSTIITTDISDHLPIITFIGKKCLTKSKTPLKLKYRPINSEILKQVHVATKIKNVPWPNILQ